LAAALHRLRGKPRPRRIVNSLKLLSQFPGDFSPRDWNRLAQELGIPLPPLERGQFPHAWQTVWDLALYVAERRPDWEFTSELSVRDWREAQIFAGVRDCLIDATGYPPAKIHREASFVNDLGLG
jgi:hypothetical protein